MASSPAQAQESLDRTGISVMSSLMTEMKPHQGRLYRPGVLAAGVPVLFRPEISGVGYLALFARRWTDAMIANGEGPQQYASFTDSQVPCWARIDLQSGLRGVPTELPAQLLSGASARGDMVFTVGASGADALIGAYRLTPTGGVQRIGTETLAPINGVTFSAGCYADTFDLLVFGTDSGGNLYMAAKNLSRIGTSRADDGVWRYRSFRGQELDPDDMDPFGLTTAGPVSMARSRGWTWLTTVSNDAGVRSAQLHRGRTLGSLKPVGDPVDLGDDATYLGGGLYLQSHLGLNLAVDPTGGSVLGVASVLVEGSGWSSVDTFWELLPYSLPGSS